MSGAYQKRCRLAASTHGPEASSRASSGYSALVHEAKPKISANIPGVADDRA